VQLGGQVDAGRQVDLDGRARLPVAGDLQHRRARQAAVGEQQVLVKAHALAPGAGGDLHRQRQAGQRRPVAAVEGEADQAGASVDALQPELPRQSQAEVGGADLGHRQAAGGDDQGGRLDDASITMNNVAYWA
jgi:hypothetical protein